MATRIVFSKRLTLDVDEESAELAKALSFFANRREPRWAIILSNLVDDPDLEEDLRRAFTVDLRQPYRNIVVPLTGAGKVDFQKLTDNSKLDGTFDKLSERADTSIMVSHRIPGDRLANAVTGPLGGNANVAANRVYKEGVVTPSQELYDSRINRLIKTEFEKANGKPPTLKLVLGFAARPGDQARPKVSGLPRRRAGFLGVLAWPGGAYLSRR